MFQVNVRRDKDMYRFQADNVFNADNDNAQDCNENFEIAHDNDDVMGPEDLDHIKPTEHLKRTVKDNISLASSIIKYQTTNWRRLIEYTLAAVLCIATLYSVVIIQSEVVGCLVEIAVFTIMGIIVNAGALLKYVMLVMMIFVYWCDCFNNIEKKYLKLNKALFNEVKSRVKDLSDITSLPSFLQENRGFKSQELGEQADYESPDDVAERSARHWMINDLVLFVDSEDTPRIPRQLFDEVCNIRVAGVPGPVFRGHIEAVTQLSKIIIFIGFVFLIVLSFSSVYRISSTNQMLATMVGGFLPMMLRMFLAPPVPDVELGTVSFKSKMDEVIKNFCQYWPMYDLPFQIAPPPSNDDDDGGSDDDKSLQTAIDVADTDGPLSDPGMNKCLSVSNYQLNSIPAAFAASNGHGHKDQNKKYPTVAPSPEYADTMESVDGKVNKETKRAPKVVRVEEPTYEDVDLIVYLPEKYDEPWLDEWSDIQSIRSKTNSIINFSTGMSAKL